ncbi:MAG: hypothetical protein NZL95_01005 [Chitinophagales bacterium]|nr:hypothetical protein [Chitinophagales bacterium]MDW8427114.1 hypothetical protein [Chitinophagales bacterium]
MYRSWLRYEFWPYPVFYAPVYGLYLWHVLRLRSLSYFTLANPGTEFGGFVRYSKYGLLRQLPSEQVPTTLYLEHPTTAESIIQLMRQKGLHFPVVLKPDRGERGWQVEKISDEKQLGQYLSHAPWPLLVQQYVAGPEEYGVMYVRYPDSAQGRITSLMQRQFLTLTGDGTSTFDQLLLQHPRCRFYLKRLRRRYADLLNTVLPSGQQIILEEIGNHNRGTTFLDITHRVSPQLTAVFDRLSCHLKEWYFGRFDVRATSFEALEQGRFHVVEVNGVNSEPAHIYDPSMSLWRAYRDLFTHWNHIYRLARVNRQRGYKPAPAGQTLQQILQHLRSKRKNPNPW